LQAGCLSQFNATFLNKKNPHSLIGDIQEQQKKQDLLEKSLSLASSYNYFLPSTEEKNLRCHCIIQKHMAVFNDMDRMLFIFENMLDGQFSRH